MKAILKYPGAKWRIADWIIGHFPAGYKVYLEPFFGSGAVFFTKPKSQIETVNDLDGSIVNLFRVCRDNPAELIRRIELTPFSREEFIACMEPTPDTIEQARQTLVRYWQSFGTSNSSRGSWKNSQTENSPDNIYQWNQLPKIIQRICGRIKEAQIENYDAIDLIRRYNTPEVLIYCDPPYNEEIRKKNMYKCELNDAGQKKLLQALKASKAKVVLSAYDNELYNSELQGWYTDEKITTAQMGLKRTEKLYMNFQPPLLYLERV